MKILLINPNRYKDPPVIPLGLEYLAGALLETGHSFQALDLCFSDFPEKDLTDAINSYKPDIAGVTIRQIDSVLYHNNEFFLPEIGRYIALCRSLGCRTVLGGAGFSIMPEQILDYTGADYGIAGPGETALVRLLDAIEKGQRPERAHNGFADFNAGTGRFSRVKLFDYDAYTRNDGIVGFRTQVGCTESCIFCTEAKRPVIHHPPEGVGREIMKLKEQGFGHFHLCDSEFNLDVERCIEVCKAIRSIAGPIMWALYMKPEPFSEELFYWLHRSGADMITLSVSTVNTDKETLERISDFLQLCHTYGIRVAVDLSTGFPHEEACDAVKVIDFLDKEPVDTVGVNSYYRVYPGTGLHAMIKQDRDLGSCLIDLDGNEDFLNPVFFNRFDLALLQKLTQGKKKFRIEGFERATNYQRLR